MDSASACSSVSSSVQQVTKKSSDELLRKFAELDDVQSAAKRELRMIKRQKRSRSARIREGDFCGSPSANVSSSLVEKRWLLPPATSRRSVLLRQIRTRYSKNKSLLGTIEKTWRRTVEGASKVFMEKHYNRHRRLINDVV